MADIVYILIVEEVAKIEAWVAHLQDFDAFVKTTKVNVCELTIYAEKFKTKHASTRAARACLDTKQVAEKLRHEVRMQDFAMERSNYKREDWYLGQILVSHEN